MTAALPPPSLVASIEEPTCCPEDELVPCTACYEKHKAEEASVEELPFTDLQQAAASLLRIPPPSIPHGHAASAPEDITHHQAHARQLPAPNPPDPRTAHSEKSGPLLAASATERTNGRETNSTAQPAAAAVAEEAAEEEPTCCPEEAELVPCSACYEKMHGHHSSPPSSATATAAAPSYAAPSAPSPLPASYPLTANTVDYNNAGVGTQSAYNVGSAMPLSTQQQQQQQMQAYSMQQPYGQLAYTASPPPSVMYGQPTMQQSQQQVDMYGNMYQQQIGAMQMPQQQQPQYMCQPGPAMYQPFPAPLTMAGPNGGTLVYYPNPAQNGAVDSSAQSQLQSPPVIQQPQQISHQVPPPGLMGYYQQPQQQPQLQLAQQQHSVSAQQPATLAFQQQPVAYVNNIPMYYTTQPPLPQQQQQQQTQPEQPAQHHSLYLPASAPASTVTSPSSSIAGDSLRSFSDVDKTCATYKTEICRSHQYSGACEYGSSCQFAHGLDELRTRDVDPKYKTERCKNYHAFGPSTCWYGPRCKFIHDEYRVRVGEREFWLISPRENMVRVEKVETSNNARLHQLCQLIVEQTGPAQQAAQQLMSQMAALTQKEQADGTAEQFSKLHLSAEQQMSTGVPAASKPDAAARFLRAIVSPQSGSSVSTPINVQAMQVASPSSTSYAAKFGPASSLSNPTTPRGHNPLLPRGLPCPTSFNGHPSHQQSSGYTSPLPFPSTSPAPQPHHRRPPPHSNPYGAYNSSPLSVLSSLLTPRALHSMLALNAGMLGVGGGVGVVDEPQRGRRRRVRKKKNRSGKAADKLDESGSSDAQDEQTAHSDDDNTDDDNEAAAAATTPTAATAAVGPQQQPQQPRHNQHSSTTSA